MINTAKTVNYNPATMKPCHCSAAKQAACPMKIALGINDDPKELLTLTTSAKSEPKPITFKAPAPSVPSTAADLSAKPECSDIPEPPKWSASAANPGVIALLDE